MIRRPSSMDDCNLKRDPDAKSGSHAWNYFMAVSLAEALTHSISQFDILSAIKDGDSLLSPYAFSGAWGSLRMGSCC